MERMIENMNYSKRLSIIVPVYNVEKYIERCLRSLLNQDIPKDEYEIIVVDDGTPDNSAKIAQHIADGSENIMVVHRENGGLSAARNTGLEHAHGRYVMFVDSDDYIESNSLAGILSCVEENQLDICIYQVVVDQADGNIIHFNKSQFANGNIYTGKELLLKGLAMTSVWHGIYSAKLLNDTGILFTPKILHEDIDFNMKIYPRASRIMYIDLEVYHYCVNAGSILRTVDLKKRMHLMKSKFDVAANVLKLSKETEDPDIAKYYIRNSSSTTFGTILSLMTESIFDREKRRECFSYARSLGVYPIRHRTSSIKSTLLIPFVNCEFFLEMLKQIVFFKEQKKAVWE